MKPETHTAIMSPGDSGVKNGLDWPRPGYFKLRAFSRGPWVPARIWEDIPIDPVTGEVLDRSPALMASIDDQAAPVEDVWIWGREIGRDDYEWIRAQWQIEKMKPSNQRKMWRRRSMPG